MPNLLWTKKLLRLMGQYQLNPPMQLSSHNFFNLITLRFLESDRKDVGVCYLDIMDTDLNIMVMGLDMDTDGMLFQKNFFIIIIGLHTVIMDMEKSNCVKFNALKNKDLSILYAIE